MKLNPSAFYQMASGEKTIELRLNDKKRKAVSIGDIIEFSNTFNLTEKLYVKVIKIYSFQNFIELYKSIPLNKCGYLPEQLDTASPEDMEKYYSITKQNQYGVVGIEIETIDL